MKRWKDFHDDKLVHAEGAIAARDFTLCGRALEGVNGDQPMTETGDRINCPACQATIVHCKKFQPVEYKPQPTR